MNKLNFAIIGPGTENTSDLIQEIEEKGHCSSVVKLGDIFLEFADGTFKAVWDKKDFFGFDIFLLRGYNKNLSFAQIITQELLERKKTVIDEAVGKKFISSKIYEASLMAQNNINHPKTWQAISLSSYKKILEKISFPIIAKPTNGQKGQGIEKIENKEQYLSFFAENTKGYLCQEFLKIDYDIRVFVVNGKALGAMKRHIIPGDYRSNASLGAKTESIPLTKELETLALKAAKIMNYEVAGVDIIEFQGKVYVLEINSSPQWQKFKEVTGINPAKYIVGYAIEKHLCLKKH